MRKVISSNWRQLRFKIYLFLIVNQDRRLVGEWGTGYDDEIMGLEIQVKNLLPSISLNFGMSSFILQ